MKREALILFTAVSQIAFAQVVGTPRPPVSVYQPAFEDLKQALGLTDAQLQQLQALQRTKQMASQAIYQQIGAKQKQLNDMLNSDKPDAQTLGQLEIDMANLRKQTMGTASVKDQALAILTDAQKAKLADLQNAMKLQRAAGEALGLGLIDPPPQAPGRGGLAQ
jgi:Spy/CpxP family protein refolding chaperone